MRSKIFVISSYLEVSVSTCWDAIEFWPCQITKTRGDGDDDGFFTTVSRSVLFQTSFANSDPAVSLQPFWHPLYLPSSQPYGSTLFSSLTVRLLRSVRCLIDL